MAAVFLPPNHIKLPAINPDFKQSQQEEEAFINELREFCKAESTCPDAGKELFFPVADGKARYMVMDYRRLILIQLGDAYQVPEAHTRGLRKADIVESIRRNEAISALFRRKAS